MLHPWVHFFRNLTHIFYQSNPFKGIPCPARTGALSSDPRHQSRDVSVVHTAGRNILSRDLASCFGPHVRPSGQETEARSSGCLLHHRNKFFPRLLTPLPISRLSMTYNPPNAQCNKCKLFSIRLTGAFSFPSLGDLPNPGIDPGSPALQADTLPSEPRLVCHNTFYYILL